VAGAHTLLLLDAALRGALIALLLLVAARVVCDRPGLPAAHAGLWLMFGLVVQTIASMPIMEYGPTAAWKAPLIGLSVGNSVLFWLFARTLFDDDFVLRPRHAGAWLAVVGLGVLFYAVVVLPQRRELAPFPLAVAIAMRWTPLVFATLAIVAAASQWRADLVEPRRRLRLLIVVMGTGYTVVTAVARLSSRDGRLSDAMSVIDTTMLLAIAGLMAVRMLRLHASELFLVAPPVPEIAGTAPPADPPTPALPAAVDHDPAEDRLAAELHRLMTEERAYRTEDLTVASLAAMLKTPEYRLRRLINQRLGHRNFNAYVNGFRLDEARRWLADPGQNEVPILTIALDAGFQSIGPFNRAFKAATGQTPTEFRKQRLADS
jgi:AraC-like DNA-binding protein